MKKICEIDDVAIHAEHGVTSKITWSRRRIPDPEWIAVAFTPAQRLFMENKKIAFRFHPKHNPTIEVFIDESELDSRDWTVLRLLF
jgi:hypothetical protein